MIEFRKLTADDSESLSVLINEIESSIANKEWWLPINTESKIHFLDDDWGYFIGAFDDQKLIGASSLFFNEHEFGESLSYCDNVVCPVAEIGRSMVLPPYRGNNLLYRMNCELLKVAKKHGIGTIIVTIHPNNMPSMNSFKKLGAVYKNTITKYGSYLRNIYTISV